MRLYITVPVRGNPMVTIGFNSEQYNDFIMSAMPYSTIYSRRRSKKTSKLRVTGLCEMNSPGTGEFPSQRSSNAVNVSIWWRLHEGPVRLEVHPCHLDNIMGYAGSPSSGCWLLIQLNRLKPGQNGRRFPDHILKCIFLNENIWSSIKISLKFVFKGPINYISALFEQMINLWLI